MNLLKPPCQLGDFPLTTLPLSFFFEKREGTPPYFFPLYYIYELFEGNINLFFELNSILLLRRFCLKYTSPARSEIERRTANRSHTCTRWDPRRICLERTHATSPPTTQHAEPHEPTARYYELHAGYYQ